MPQPDRTNIAVFIDFDNIEIGVKSTLGEHFDVGTILDALKERGEVVTKIAYADWTRAGEYSRHLTQHAIRLVQRNLTPGGDKNGADINLALDALEMAFTHPHINAYVIVGGDSDFLSLVEKLKQYDKKVFVVGGRAFTSMILQRNCHEFIAYENLISGRRSVAKGGRPAPPTAVAPVSQAIPIVRRALKILAEREVSPQTGLLKSTLLQLDSTFSERNYGASSFLDFVEKLAKQGVVTLKSSGRSVMVELTDAYRDGATITGDVAEESPAAEQSSAAPPSRPTENAYVQPVGTTVEGAALAGRILAAAKHARWPMYLRNVKQILRQHRSAEDAAGFDERRYGFSGLMDLLKALQRENVVRLERDRRGGLRVQQGGALQRAAPSTPIEGLPQVDESYEGIEAALVESQPGEAIETQEPIETEQPEAEPTPMPVDTTAELLGRAKVRKPRASRLPRAVAASGPKRSAKKPAAKRAPRARKPTTDETGEP